MNSSITNENRDITLAIAVAERCSTFRCWEYFCEISILRCTFDVYGDNDCTKSTERLWGKNYFAGRKFKFELNTKITRSEKISDNFRTKITIEDADTSNS